MWVLILVWGIVFFYFSYQMVKHNSLSTWSINIPQAIGIGTGGMLILAGTLLETAFTRFDDSALPAILQFAGLVIFLGFWVSYLRINKNIRKRQFDRDAAAIRRVNQPGSIHTAAFIFQDNRIQRADADFARISGYDETELIGKHIQEVFGPAAHKSLHNHISRLTHQNIFGIYLPVTVLLKNKTPLKVHAYIQTTTHADRQAILVTLMYSTVKPFYGHGHRDLFEVSPDHLESVLEAIVVHRHSKIVYANTAAAKLLGVNNPTVLLNKTYQSITAPADRQRVETQMRNMYAAASHSHTYEQRFLGNTGAVIDAEVIHTPCRSFGEDAIQTIIKDVRAVKQAERLFEHQKHIMTLLAHGEPLSKTLHEVAKYITANVQGAKCAIMQLDSTDNDLRVYAAIGLSREFCNMLDGLQIKPDALTPGRAAYLGDVVVTTNIPDHFHWQPYQEITLASGIQSACAMPIFTDKGNLLGVVSLYFTTSKSPTLQELQVLESAADLISIALESRRKQKALELSEEKYRLLFDSSVDAVLVFNLNDSGDAGRLVEVNAMTCDMLEYQRPELTTMDFLDIIDPTLSFVVNQNLMGLNNGSHILFESVLVSKSATKIPVEMILCSFIFQNQPAALVVARDLRERYSAEMALEESARRFQGLFNRVPLGLYRSARNGKILEANPTFIEMFGFARKNDVYHRRSEQFYVNSEDRAHWMELVLRDGLVRSFDVQMRREDGTRMWVRENARAVFDENDEIIAFEGSLEDISMRRQMEQALAEEKERLSVTLRSIGDGVITTDTRGHITLMNRVAEALTGWADQAYIGRPVVDVFLAFEEDSEALYPPVQIVLDTQTSVKRERALLLKSRTGTNRRIAINASPLFDDAGVMIGAVLVFRDVDKLYVLEQELIKSKKLESLGLLAGGIAHNFNNILTAIMGNISMAQLHLSDTQELNKRLLKAESATKAARSLTKQLLTFAKGGAPIKRAASIVEIIQETAQFSTSGKAVRCVYAFDDDLWTVEVDEGQISQVINNLVVNAIQAMPTGGDILISAENVMITAQNQVWEVLLREGAYVRIEVSDDGVGIPRQVLSQVFDPYFTTKHKGSGLGLATSYSIVKKHGGYIFVKSEEANGTTFIIYLPASPQKTVPVRKREDTLQHGSGRILVMDDEQSVLEVLKEMLLHLGYEVELSRDGNEAIARYREKLATDAPYQAVIMDLTIPGGMGGKQAVRRLREIDPALKAIVSSGYNTHPVMAQFREYGFDDCIPKPYNIAVVSEVLQRVLQASPVLTNRE